MLFLDDLFTFITDEKLGMLIGIIVPFIVLLFFAKYRGIWASVWFLPVVYIATLFIGDKVTQLHNFYETNRLFKAFLEGYGLLLQPFFIIHELIMSLFALIAPDVEFLHTNIFGADWFPLAFYALVWIIFMLIFKKRRKRRSTKRYEDDF